MTPIIIDDNTGNWVMAEHIVGVHLRDDKQIKIYTRTEVSFFSTLTPKELMDRINSTEDEVQPLNPLINDVVEYKNDNEQVKVLVTGDYSGLVLSTNMMKHHVGSTSGSLTWDMNPQYWTNLGPLP
jgi:hypothetical protein